MSRAGAVQGLQQGLLRSAATGQRRFAGQKIVPHGKGGRSSIGGRVATVFGAVGHWSPNNGFLGRYLVQRLGVSGSQVVIPYYGDELETRFLRVMGDLGQIHFQEYGILDERSVSKSVAYSNVAVNLTGLDYKTRHFSLEDVHVTGAANLARAAKQAGVERFVHVSAVGADEGSASDVLKTKALGEQAVLEEFPEATILRHSDMFGTEDKFISRLADLASMMPGPFPLLNEGAAVKSPVYVADVAEAIVAALDTPETAGHTYELVGPTEYTMKQLVQYIGDTTRKPISTIPLPDIATEPAMFGLSLAGFARLESLPNEEEFYKYANSDVKTKRAPGLAELGVNATRLEEIGLHILRRYRSHLYHDDIDAVLGGSK